MASQRLTTTNLVGGSVLLALLLTLWFAFKTTEVADATPISNDTPPPTHNNNNENLCAKFSSFSYKSLLDERPQYHWLRDAMQLPEVEDLEFTLLFGRKMYTRTVDANIMMDTINKYVEDNSACLTAAARYVINIGAGTNGFLYDPTYEVVRSGKYLGLLVEPNSRPLESVRAEFRAWGVEKNFAFVNDFAHVENVVDLFQKNSVPKSLSVLKIDIDTYDCMVLREILENGYRPDLFVGEINPVIPPPVRFAVQYHAGGMPMFNNAFYGCSLSYMSTLLREYGYVLIQLRVWDAYYVKKEYVEAFGSVPHNDLTLYNYGYYQHDKLLNPKAYDVLVEHVMSATCAWNKSALVYEWMYPLAANPENPKRPLPFTVDY